MSSLETGFVRQSDLDIMSVHADVFLFFIYCGDESTVAPGMLFLASLRLSGFGLSSLIVPRGLRNSRDSVGHFSAVFTRCGLTA